MKKTYAVHSAVWLYPGETAAWHFTTIPPEITDDIDAHFPFKRGWGSLPVVVTLGDTTWKTSIFPDKKTGSYLLPLKAEVRKKEKISAKDSINFTLELEG